MVRGSRAGATEVMPAVLGGPGGVRSLANVVCQEVRGVVSSAPLWVPAGPCPLTCGVSSGERLTPSLSSLPIHWAHWTTDLKGSLMLLFWVEGTSSWTLGGCAELGLLAWSLLASHHCLMKIKLRAGTRPCRRRWLVSWTPHHSPPLAVLVPEYENLGTRVGVHLTCDESKAQRR